jgi:hypothetical protein
MRVFLSLIVLIFSTPGFNQTELIKNGDFADSASNEWLFGENGASASVSIEHQKCQIVINSPGSNLWSPQLQQVDIPLLKDTAYTLKFDAWATSTGKIEVILCSSTFKKYLDTTLDISSIKTSTVINWIMNDPSDTHARIQFNFGYTSSLNVIGLDNVSLVKRNEPVIRILEPNAASRWHSGTSTAIKWTNSGLLEMVNIRFSTDGGSNWVTVADSLENKTPHLFTWAVPSNAYGDNCVILVSSPDGLCNDTSESFAVLDDDVDSINNLIQNGSFHDKSKWSLQVYSPANARDTIINEEMLVVINATGSAPWQVKLQQDKIALEQYKFYEFSFDAYSTSSRTIYANVGFTSGIPAWSVNRGDSIPDTVTSAKKRFTSTFYMNYPSSKSALVEFNLGNNLRDVYIDNVALRAISIPQSEFLEPLSGHVLKCGDSSSIQWTPGPLKKVGIHFSADSGRTWTGISRDTVLNTGTVRWVVPEVSSNNCFLKIVNPVNGDITGFCGKFSINKFGTEIKSGELVTNGSFDDSLKGWDGIVLTNGAVAVPELNANAFGIMIMSGGSDFSDIILSQGGLVLLTGNSYLMSFSAFSVSQRAMRVRLVDDDTAAVNTLLFDTLVNLPLTINNFRFEIKVPGDCNVKMQFLLGGDSADIYIDDISLRIPSVVKTSCSAMRTHPAAIACRYLSASKIEFRGSSSFNGIIDIFTLNGVRVARLPFVDGYALWDGERNAGFARGSYLARITTRQFKATLLLSTPRR